MLDFLSFSFIYFPLQGGTQTGCGFGLVFLFSAARACALEPTCSLGLVFELGLAAEGGGLGSG